MDFELDSGQRASTNAPTRAHPGAVFHGTPITGDDVLASPMIADPIHMLEAVMRMHGGAGVLIANADIARRGRHRPVWITGCGEHIAFKTPTYADKAFAMAGPGRSDVDIASIYDCYTLALIPATPERPDDGDTTLRVAFGNESTDRDIAEFARRFGCRVVDSFGSSEFAVIVVREDGAPPGSIGKPYPGVSIYNPTTLKECAVAQFDEHCALTNFDDAVGELVNTQGAGPFTGYYNDPAATAERMHVLVRRFALPRRGRLDLSRRPHRGLDASRRRELGRGADRADPGTAAGGQPGRGLRRAR
jgi:hypothetical protein